MAMSETQTKSSKPKKALTQIKLIDRRYVSYNKTKGYVMTLPSWWVKEIEHARGIQIREVIVICGKYLIILPPDATEEEIKRAFDMLEPIEPVLHIEKAMERAVKRYTPKEARQGEAK